MQDKDKGLYTKYDVINIQTGKLVNGCFVLRPDKDPAAIAALATYANHTTNTKLAEDIEVRLESLLKHKEEDKRMNKVRMAIAAMRFKVHEGADTEIYSLDPESYYTGKKTLTLTIGDGIVVLWDTGKGKRLKELDLTKLEPKEIVEEINSVVGFKDLYKFIEL